jgi:hypothetical protein
MTDEEMIRLNYRHYASLFPRACTSCGRHFQTLRDYILSTKPVGATISYDAELGEWNTTQPLGAAAMANCPCGSTIALTTDGVPLAIRQAMLDWIRVQIKTRGVTQEQLLGWVRGEVRKMALAEQDPNRT